MAKALRPWHRYFSSIPTSSSIIPSIPNLTPSQVSSILRRHEYARDVSHSAVTRIDTNMLPANNPTEDHKCIAQLPQDGGLLFGVFDGHGGQACAQSICRRLFKYIAASMLDEEQLRQCQHLVKNNEFLRLVSLLEPRAFRYNENLEHLHRSAFDHYLKKLQKDFCPNTPTSEILRRAFLQLDDEISNDAVPTNRHFSVETLSIALSGSTACVAYVDDKEVQVANTGDSMAVIGRLSDSGEWEAVPMSHAHCADNPDEVKRLKEAHPNEETVFREGRLLGTLVPLRAFGDVPYKWQANTLAEVKQLLTRQKYDSTLNVYTQHPYKSPPYLTAEPEVIRHVRTPADKFIILATDGLWDWMSTKRAVQLVGEHSIVQAVETEYAPPAGIKLSELLNVLEKRASLINRRTQDTNAATHLLRSALGWCHEVGDIQHVMLSGMLSAPGNVRSYRDDVTIIVAFFNSPG